jgi:endonuclease/exonuclease/phosphatase family metal-dependent hydrolase
MRVRIATLNTWGLPSPLSEQPLARMAEIARRLPGLGLDVVAFQELWTRGARRVLREACAAEGLVHTWSTRADYGGSGLFVLSRHPIASARFQPFSVRGYAERVDHGDYYGGKGFVQLELAHPEGRFSLLTTHLHARYGSDVESEYTPQRVAQIVQLSHALWPAALPTVAVGDFNFTDRHDEHALLTGLSRLRDAALELGDPQATTLARNPYRGDLKPDRRIDYVFVRDGAGARVRPLASRRVLDEVFELRGRPASVSDHAGLVADVEIVPGPGRDLTPPDADTVARAGAWLQRGRAGAARRREEARAYAGVGVAAAAALALAPSRTPVLSRRRLLRGGLQALALLAVPPSLGLSVFSEVLEPDEIRAFDDLSATLLGRRSA